MIKTYTPKGVCSQKMEIELEDGVIKNVKVIGGCDGNLKGIMSLVKGCRAEDVIERLNGIECRTKGTSCPDQLAKALEEEVKEEKQAHLACIAHKTSHDAFSHHGMSVFWKSKTLQKRQERLSARFVRIA